MRKPKMRLRNEMEDAQRRLDGETVVELLPKRFRSGCRVLWKIHVRLIVKLDRNPNCYKSA